MSENVRKETTDDLRAARLDDRIAEVARLTARELIDLGAACQKAKTFEVATTEGAPLRSVYEVIAEKLEARLRRLVHG